MKLTLRFAEYNSHNQSYVRITTIRIKDYPTLEEAKAEIDELLEKVENGGKEDKRIKHDERRMPKDYSGAGGFCTDLISCLDEEGKDQSKLVRDWYGRPTGREP